MQSARQSAIKLQPTEEARSSNLRTSGARPDALPTATLPATYEVFEQELARCLTALANLASTSGETDRVGRLLEAAGALSVAPPSIGSTVNSWPGKGPLVDGSPLTDREYEVALLIARGLTNRQIGQRLIISERTADTHVQNILGKLALGSRSQVAVWVIERQRSEADFRVLSSADRLCGRYRRH